MTDLPSSLQNQRKTPPTQTYTFHKIPLGVPCLTCWMQVNKLLGNALQHQKTKTNTSKNKEQYLTQRGNTAESIQQRES